MPRPAALARRIDSVRVVNMLSGAGYADPPGQLAARLGLETGEQLYTTIGGNAPQWLVNHAADDLATGRRRAVLIAGGEALHTLRLASKQGVDLAWAHGRGRAVMIGDDRQGSHPDEWRYGLQMPTQIYPLFEIALRAHERRDPRAIRPTSPDSRRAWRRWQRRTPRHGSGSKVGRGDRHAVRRRTA